MPRCVMVDLEPTVTQMCLSKVFCGLFLCCFGSGVVWLLTESILRVRVFHVCIERQTSLHGGFLKTGGR